MSPSVSLPEGDDPVTAYARAVVSKEIVAGPYIRAACERHLNDLATGGERGLRFDTEAVERVIHFFLALTIEVEEGEEDGEVKSRVVPFVLQPWQVFIVGSLIGWKNSLGLRRFRRAYIEAAKGCGKSPLAAGIGLYFLCGKGINKERGQIFSAATSREQATILFRDAIAMWKRSRVLRKRLATKGKQTQTISQLTHIASDAFFRPVSAENKGQSGLRPYCALIDEVHEHADNTVIEMMRAGTKGNQEALIFEITNSGFDKRTVCGQEHDYSVQVVTGEVQNDSWFAYICGLDEGDEPFEDEACWIKANPNLGISIHPEYIREQVQEAKGMPSKEGTVRRLNFCQWTDSENSAIPRELWEACEGVVDPDALHEAGYRCFGGLDLSRVNDLTAFTLTWVIDETKDKWKFASKTWFWTPKDTLLDRARKDRAPYDVWAREGHLQAVPGKMIKFPWVADALMDLCTRYNPENIGCDQYGLTQLLDQLAETGQSLPCVVHPQGFNKRVVGERDGVKDTGAEDIILWMPDSINKLEAALLEGRITIDINPVMRMCSQAVIYTMNRTGHRMFDKEKATRRIDGMVSLAMSLGVATSRPTFDLSEFLANAVMR
jgi:phage terminase large subunit-like protein